MEMRRPVESGYMREPSARQGRVYTRNWKPRVSHTPDNARRNGTFHHNAILNPLSASEENRRSTSQDSRRNRTVSLLSVPEKRTRSGSRTSRGSSRNRGYPTPKRPRQHSRPRPEPVRSEPVPNLCPQPEPAPSSSSRPEPVPVPTSELCLQCKRICWDRIDDWIRGERNDWRGKTICTVGTRFRSLPPDTKCQLCLQLWAPWIDGFLIKQEVELGRINDSGDEIRIFGNLRHIPLMNDQASSRKFLRIHGAPCHIAVVPRFGIWKDEIKEHLVTKGMVIVVPKAFPDSKLFAPQQVPRKFDPDLVVPCLDFCKDNHSKLCKIQPPIVLGMKVIDCSPDKPVIRHHHHGDPYVALSYVWGKPAAGEETSSWVAGDELPDDLPLTIRDAISVTKSLGQRFLWIDQYCINQKDNEEKAKQCSRMGDIYAGSQLTIFALGDSSKYGLPGVSDRNRIRCRQCTQVDGGIYKFVSTLPDAHLSIKTSVWSSRVWTYQEGLFSTRRLFFTDFQIYYECNAMNCVETFESDLNILHIQKKQRYRAFHRAGQFVCGNSNHYSHLNVGLNKANHRKIDTIRRCLYQTRQYTKRELTNKNDILHAYSGIPHFYAKTTASIISLAGLTIPFPIAKLDLDQEGLDHLSYALAWTHRFNDLQVPKPTGFDAELAPQRKKARWTPFDNPKPQIRQGFPSWSWAGWFGEIANRNDLPYRWTSHLSSVRIGYPEGYFQDYALSKKNNRYKHPRIAKRLTANIIKLDAYVIDPQKLWFGPAKTNSGSISIPWHTIQVSLPIGPHYFAALRPKLISGEFEIMVIGSYGKPRKGLFEAIIAADPISKKAQKRRIEIMDEERVEEPDAIVCLLVKTVDGISRRAGVLRILPQRTRDYSLEAWKVGSKRSFTLM